MWLCECGLLHILSCFGAPSYFTVGSILNRNILSITLLFCKIWKVFDKKTSQNRIKWKNRKKNRKNKENRKRMKNSNKTSPKFEICCSLRFLGCTPLMSMKWVARLAPMSMKWRYSMWGGGGQLKKSQKKSKSISGILGWVLTFFDPKF